MILEKSLRKALEALFLDERANESTSFIGSNGVIHVKPLALNVHCKYLIEDSTWYC